MRRDPLALAVQLRLPLAPACEWHSATEHLHAGATTPSPCPRDARLCVTDAVRGRRAVCCLPHALALVTAWRTSVPNRRRNAARVGLAWLPDAPRRRA